MSSQRKVLFVCLGNVCRSPAAEVIFRTFAEKRNLQIEVASCGLADWNAGRMPDQRMCDVALEHGFDLKNVRSQPFKMEFFEDYDWIFAADKRILEALQRGCPKEYVTKLHLFTAFSSKHRNLDVPDPYVGQEETFERVIEMIEDACLGIVEEMR